MSQHLPFGGVPPQPSQRQPTYSTIPTTIPVPPVMPPAQQSAFLHNAQLPGIDMATVLQGITPEQLAYIGQLYQAGQIPLPPVPAPAHTQAPAVQAPPAVQQAGAPLTVKSPEDPMSGDKEDGEWEEEELTPQVVPDFLRPPPTGPRKRSSSFHMHAGQNGADKRTKRQPSPPRQPHSYDRRRPALPSDQISSSPRSHVRQRAAKQEAARTFILAAYRAGYSFEDLSREVGDARMLRILFKELGLNAPSEKKQPDQPEVEATPSQARVQLTAAVVNKPVATANKGSPLGTPTAKPAIKPVAKPAVPPKAPATADRSAYLAKLQAAKNKKNEDMPKSAKPVETPMETKAPAVQQQPPPVTASTIQTQPAAQQPRKAIIQTDLIRKKLEALKGEQARRQEAERLASAQGVANSRPAATAPAIPTRTIPTAPSTGLTETSQRTPNDPAEQAIVSPAQPFDFASQFPGLPGLFMTGTPPQVSAPLRAQVDPIALSKPLAAAEPVEKIDSEDSMDLDRSTSADGSPFAPIETSEQPQTSVPAKSSTFSSGQATPKHPFNQGKYDSNDDSVIIHVSDEEESELDDMDEDEDSPPTPVNRDVIVKTGPLRNLPAPTSASVSAPGTPGATTPGGTAYQRKLQEIHEMHRRIAEMQKQPKKIKAPPAMPPIVAQANASTSLPGLSTNAPAAAATVAKPKEQQAAESSQQMEAKLARLQEEAVIISEQRQTSQSNSNDNNNNDSVMQAGISGVAEDATSDMSDDDDAMDLSSGEDSDSSDEDDVEAPAPDVITNTSGSHVGETKYSAHDDAKEEEDSSSSDDSDSSIESEESDEDYEPAPAVPEAKDVSLHDPETPTISTHLTPQYDADLAPELQSSKREQDEPTPEKSKAPKPYYKPYESPLRMFRDYRFHPQFTSDVQGGFRSLTYSNKIDPKEAMCPEELSTGACQDRTCDLQHFANTAINDAELLRDLGTRNAPWKTEEEKTRWNNGLTDLVRHLRTSNQGTDVNAIAAHIAQYRRDFVDHPDQIINLSPNPNPDHEDQ